MYSGLSINDFYYMAEGAGRTVYLAAWSITLGTLLGLLLGWLRAKTARNPFGNVLLAGYLDIFRSIPLIIQFILFNSMAAVIGFPMDPVTSGIVVLTLYMGAYCAEIVRGGYDSVPLPTRRAGRSLGMTYWQDLRYVVMPLGLRTIFPAWVGLVVGIVKDTALVAVLGYIELLRASQIVITRTQEPILVLSGVGLFYFAICFPISQYSKRLERRMAI